ncbi:50S ribosomal protein L7/L12 [Vermiphilus pyriformis]|jgi:large subunit ribosomal protein L7/L12|uniref:Large ribosomal subunit protein bL12 n=1 Tax=candidate division TM6 bacterium JCVI TM6SC1 TaxID=1306947 RepID=A0A0D2GPG5_9BACT|nr:hypothetical protein J120_02875 [candidate division TM6 bacterium JCVI TM6SC1]UNE35291.1 MAG: 50S ribosomal protein L7/L12 [Vermiphilus pyriformis]
MARSFDTMIDEIGKMSVLELADLIKSLEEKLGVSAAMPVAAAAPAAGASAAAAPAEEKQSYKVTLATAGSEKIKTIKALREVTTLSLTDAKNAVEGVPTVIAESAPKAEAQKMKEKLEAAGAKVELA